VSDQPEAFPTLHFEIDVLQRPKLVTAEIRGGCLLSEISFLLLSCPGIQGVCDVLNAVPEGSLQGAAEFLGDVFGLNQWLHGGEGASID
jgi:hypothetical protein